LVLSPVLVGLTGALFERWCLRRVHAMGHVPELLLTFGLSYIILEVVQLIWGRSAMNYRVPPELDGPLFTLFETQFPMYRAFMMGVSLLMLLALWWLLTRTRIGLLIQAALTHPETVQSLGHDVPLIFMGVFGTGAALAGLAGVLGGNTFVTEPGMAATVGSVIFVVVVVGGMGSLAGAFLASLLIGLVQTFAVAIDQSMLTLLQAWGHPVTADAWGHALLDIKVSQVAPILPYVLLVLMLIFRPRGLLGTREG
jgi:branched-chain amino acid transport system permease protein